MTIKDKFLAHRIYLLLAALFITSLVVSNLIFQKFFYWYPIDIEIFDTKLFEISVGILPYPITFLITDLISEIYGKKRANDIVVVGIFASVFSLLIIYVGSQVPATSRRRTKPECMFRSSYAPGPLMLSTKKAVLGGECYLGVLGTILLLDRYE